MIDQNFKHKLKFTITLILLFGFGELLAQSPFSSQADRSLEGYWQGALIRGNTVQRMNAEIYEQGDSLVIASEIPDWAYYPPRVSRLKVDEDRLMFETYYGKAEMRLDSTYMEMVGMQQDVKPELNLHLKKGLRPPEKEIASQEISIKNKSADISGTLYYRSDLDAPMPVAIIMHGRGCAPRNWKASRAKKLAEYGIAGFVYDKRGSNPSGFPCEESTHDLNVSDITKMVSTLTERPDVDADRVGLISYSAGGWIAPHVTAKSKIPIAFMVTVVGPTTSVKQQQLDGMRAFMENANMSEEAIGEALEYIALLFTEDDYESAYERMQELLKMGEESGWTEWLVEDDYADSPEAMKEMWVQRFSYDPGQHLKEYDGPYLAIFGENDPVVPYQEQIDRLDELFAESDRANVHAKIIAKGSHGLEHGHRVVDMGKGQSSTLPEYYFKFDRVAYGAMQYIVDFLDEYEMLSE